MKDLHTTPDEHLEARITAWVLGQASPFEAAELEALCAADPELQLFLNRTKALHSLLLETPPSSSDQFWKLSPENREKLDPIIGSNHSTLSNNHSGIRRAAYRTAFGIAAVLTVTLFIKRFIFAPLSSDKEASTLVAYESTLNSQASDEEVFFEKSASDSPSKSIATSSPRKPSAPSASAPAPAEERDTTLALLDSKFKNDSSPRTRAESNKPAGMAPGSPIVSKDLEVAKAEQQPSALSDDRFTKAETKKQETRQNAMARNVPQEEQKALADNGVVNDGGIGYGSGGSGQSDMSNTYPAFEALALSNKADASYTPAAPPATIPVPTGELAKPSMDYGDGKDFGKGWGSAEGKANDALAANDNQDKGGFRYEPGASKKESLRSYGSFSYKEKLAETEKRMNDDSSVTSEDSISLTGVFDSYKTQNTEGNRSGNDAVERKSIDGILSNPDRSIAANKEAERGPATQAPVDGISFSDKGLAQREKIRRQSDIRRGDEALMEGREAYAKGDYAQAADKYKEALGAVRDIPAQADRQEAYAQHLSDASVAQAQQMRKVGKYDEARRLLEQAETLSPADATIKNELGYLNDPIRTNPVLTYEHVEKVDQVRRDLYKAQGNYDLGKYDDAKKSYEDILRVDPYNEAARRGMEKVESTKNDYYRAAYSNTGGLLMDVDKAWELAVPAEGEMNEVPLSSTSQSGLANLRKGGTKNDLSILLEADVANNQKNNSAPADAVGYMNMMEDETTFRFATRSGAERRDISVTREFQYPAEYETPVPGNVNPAVDPFAAWGGVSISGSTFSSYLNSRTEGEDIQGEGFKGFANLEAPADGEPKQVKVTTKFVEITQANDKELGFDWVIDPFAKDSTTTGQVPLLGEIPITGRLFQEGKNGGIESEISVGYKSEYLFRGQVMTDQKKPSLIDLSNELSAAEEAFSTFSLNISDASFQLALAAIEKGERPDPTSIKPEQFYNAVDYGDPAPSASEPVAAAIDQTAHPVIPGRNLVRVALRTGSTGRSAAQPLRLTLLVDQSGSMVRADRRVAMETALAQLATLLTEHDQVTVIGFSRTPHLLAQSLPGNQAAKLPELINQTASEGGTNLEQAINLATEQALGNHLAGAQNRIVLFTDGAANLGDADPDRLSEKIKNIRQQGLAFDIAGIGTNDVNDKLLSDLARHGNGRYYLVGEKTAGNLAAQLAGAFRPAAENVKVQVKLNPQRVGNYKLIGFEKDRLKTEDFRNDAVDAAELAADEAGVALYQVETLTEGTGEIGEVSVRFRDTATGEMVERTWTIPYDASAPSFDKANPKSQLATLALLAAQKLQTGPMADAIDFSNYSETIAKLKQANAKSAKTQQLLNLINAIK